MHTQRRNHRRVAAAFFALASCCAVITSATLVHASEPARGFYMTMWHATEEGDVDLVFYEPGAPTDPKPTSRYILNFEQMFYSLENTPEAFEEALRSGHYDWSQVAAVMIDEPYWTALGRSGLPPAVAGQSAVPCGSYLEIIYQQNIDQRYPYLLANQTRLDNLINAVRKLSPTTHIWMNFSEPEIKWILTLKQLHTAGLCGTINLLRDGIDVVSFDKYRVPMSEVAPYYDQLRQYFPTLKFGLVPGLIYSIPAGDIASNPAVPAGWLQQFFDYANTTNAAAGCTVDVRNAATNSTDNCPIWLVAGWHGSKASTHYVVDGGGFANGNEQAFFYCGDIYDTNPSPGCSSSSPIRDAWRAQLGTIVSKRKAALTAIYEYSLK